MIRLAANISTMFTELPFAERIEAAAKAGFRAVECQFPYVVGACGDCGPPRGIQHEMGAVQCAPRQV